MTGAVRLRFYLGESDRRGGQPLSTAIVEAARKAGLGGATVFKGIEGFGAHSVVHAARVLDLSHDLPILVEVIDERGKIDAFLASIEAWLADAMVTIDPVQVVYRSSGNARG